MSKHTPGPWRLNENNNWKTNPFSVTVRKPGVHSTTVANIPTRMTVPPQEQQANARLISAAPDLLEALKGLYHPQPSVDAFEKARVAMYKATGGEV